MAKGKHSFAQVFEESYKLRPRHNLTQAQRSFFMFDGVSSSRDLDAAGYMAVMTRFEWLGFTITAATTGQMFGPRPSMASPRQVELIRELWGEFKDDDANDLNLGHWLWSAPSIVRPSAFSATTRLRR